jgi:glycosyltransferase involved in cell wall biosynthesis
MVPGAAPSAEPAPTTTGDLEARAARAPRVLVVAPLYHTDRGGLGRQCVLLTERLADLGLRCEVATRHMVGLPRRAFSPRVPIHALPAPRPEVHNYEQPNLVNLATSLSFSLGLAAHLVRRRREVDLVHFHGASLPLLVALPVAKLLDKPVLALVAATHQGVEAGDFRHRWGPLGKALAWGFARVDGYIAITREIRECLEKDGVAPERVWEVPNFIDFQDFRRPDPAERAELRQALGFEGRTVVLASGRLVPRKNGDVLIRAFAKARARPGVAASKPLLVFCGDGPERDAWEAIAREVGVHEDVRFDGFCDDMPRRLGAADVLALVSTIEGSPNALLEGLAMGLACVASEIAGALEIIDPGENGLLVGVRDEATLTDALARVLADPALRSALGEESARRMRAERALEVVAPRYLPIYEELMARARSSGA